MSSVVALCVCVVRVQADGLKALQSVIDLAESAPEFAVAESSE